MTTTTAPPATSEALVFYTAACPLVERLLTLARAWRDRAPSDPEAIRAHSEWTWAAVRLDLRLARSRRHDPTADPTRAPAEPARHYPIGPGCPRGASSTPRCRSMPAAPAPGHPTRIERGAAR